MKIIIAESHRLCFI